MGISRREALLAVVLLALPVGADVVLRHRTVSLNEGLTLVSSRQDWGNLGIDRSVNGGALRVGGKPFVRGLGTHAASTSVLGLAPGMSMLSGACGVDDEASARASVRFRVTSPEGAVLFESPVMHAGDPPASFSVRVGDSRVVRLETDGVGSITDDHADWVELVARP